MTSNDVTDDEPGAPTSPRRAARKRPQEEPQAPVPVGSSDEEEEPLGSNGPARSLPPEHESEPVDDGEPLQEDSETTCRAEALILVIYQEGRGRRGSLDRSVYYEVTQQVDALLPPGVKYPHLDIWLDSPGGDAHAAYKLAVYLRTRFQTVHVVVPDYAKSASTLLSLAGERIYMGPGAELGPLDVQDRREGEDRMHSTLDTANAMSTLFQDSIALALSAGPMLLATTGLARDRTIEHLLEFTAAFTRPLVEKLDPEEILSASTSLLLSMNYASRLLKGVEHISPDRADALASSLVTDYPTHGHVIDRREARDTLGLPIFDLESYPWGEEAVKLLRLMQDKPALVHLSNSEDIVQFLEMNSDDDESDIDDESHGTSNPPPDRDDVPGQEPAADEQSDPGPESDHGAS